MRILLIVRWKGSTDDSLSGKHCTFKSKQYIKIKPCLESIIQNKLVCGCEGVNHESDVLIYQKKLKEKAFG